MDTAVEGIEQHKRRDRRSAGAGLRADPEVYGGHLRSDGDAVGDSAFELVDHQLAPAGELLYHLPLLHGVFRVKVDKVEHQSCILGIELRAHPLNEFLTHLLLRYRIAVASL